MSDTKQDLRKINATLLTTLKNAKDHLEYCGYGDAWERECADASGLAEKIDVALAMATGEQKP